jgi:hypothetical protein
MFKKAADMTVTLNPKIPYRKNMNKPKRNFARANDSKNSREGLIASRSGRKSAVLITYEVIIRGLSLAGWTALRMTRLKMRRSATIVLRRETKIPSTLYLNQIRRRLMSLWKSGKVQDEEILVDDRASPYEDLGRTTTLQN